VKVVRRGSGSGRGAMRAILGSSLVVLAVTLLAGCPKKPEVGQAGPTAVGPQAAVTAPTPTTVGPPAKAAETPVSQPSPPREAPVSQPSPPREAPVSRPSSPREAATTRPSTPDKARESALKDIFFDFDKATIREDQKAAVAADAARLKASPTTKVLVEGHCDERGTAEYNLALGERRAKAMRDALVASGIEASRIRTVSYGKERPFALGHDESAWNLNRRAHLVLE